MPQSEPGIGDLAQGAELVGLGAGIQNRASPHALLQHCINLPTYEVCFLLTYIPKFSLLSISEWPVSSADCLALVNSVFISVTRRRRHSAKRQAVRGEGGCRFGLTHHALRCFLSSANHSARRRDGKSVPLCCIFFFFREDVFSALARRRHRLPVAPRCRPER